MTDLIELLNISTSPYINALVLIGAFIIIAKAMDLFVNKVVRKFTGFTKSDIDDRIIDAVHRPIYFTVILIGVVLAVAYLKPSEKIAFYTYGFFYSIIAVVWMVTAIRISNAIIEGAVHKVSDVTGLSKDIVPLIENVLKIVIIVSGLMVVLSIWRINITPLLASAGIAGVAVALAAKDTIANFFGGVSVFVDKPFKIGDFVVLDQGERGEVVAIGVRSTRIRTQDDIQITIPNSIIANTKIKNESAPLPNSRMRVSVLVAYGSDIDLVQQTLLDIATCNQDVMDDPPAKVWFTQFGESGMNFELLCWYRDPAIKGQVVHELNCAIYKKFNELGIRIPFPQREVHMRGEVWKAGSDGGRK